MFETYKIEAENEKEAKEKVGAMMDDGSLWEKGDQCDKFYGDGWGINSVVEHLSVHPVHHGEKKEE